MGIEIERKFLVRGDAWRHQARAQVRMRQAYLGGDHCSVRVRIEGDRALLNIKSRTTGIVRREFEYPIPRLDADVLLGELAGPALDKVRHHVPVDGWLFEVDEFLGDNAGLVVAEVELPAADADFPRPPWLGREVSMDRRYLNLALVETPFAQWPDRADILEELKPC